MGRQPSQERVPSGTQGKGVPSFFVCLMCHPRGYLQDKGTQFMSSVSTGGPQVPGAR